MSVTAVAAGLVRRDPSMARAARAAASVLLKAAGVKIDAAEPAGVPQRRARKRVSG